MLGAEAGARLKSHSTRDALREAIRLRPEAAWGAAGAPLRDEFFRGRLGHCLEALEARIARGGQESWLFTLRAELKLSPGLARHGEALEDIDRACRGGSGSFWVLGYAAKGLAHAGRLGEAGAVADEAVALEPRSPWLLTERSWIRLRSGQTEEALADASSALELTRETAGAELARAASLARLGRWGEALEAHDRAVRAAERPQGRGAGSARRRPPFLSGCPVDDADELRFRILRSLGRFKEAAESLRRALLGGVRLSWAGDDSPGPQGPAEVLSQTQAAQGDGKLDPWLFFWRGEALLRANRLAEAEAEFSRSLRRPSFFWSLAWRAWCRLSAGKPAEGEADARRALAALKRAAGNPDLPPVAVGLEGRLRTILAELLLQRGDFSGAAGEFTRAIALDGTEAGALLGRAKARVALGETGAAEADLNKALETDPRRARGHILRAQLRTRRGNLEGAQDDLARAKRAASGAEVPALRWPLPEPRRNNPPAGGPRRLGRVTLEAGIELLGLIQAVERGSPFQVDPELRRPSGEALVGEYFPTQDSLATVAVARPLPGTMKATQGFPWAEDFAGGMAEYSNAAVRRFKGRLGKEFFDVFRRAAKLQGNATSPWYGMAQMFLGMDLGRGLTAEGPEWRHPENLRLLESLRRLAREGGFSDYLARRRKRFEAWLAPLKETVEREAYAETVSEYIGVRVDAYYDVVLTPLLRDVTLCAILKGDGVWGARTILCPMSHSSDFLRSYDHEYLLWRGWHEMLHGPMDAWTALHDGDLGTRRELHALVGRGARRKNWTDCVAEHAVRAVTQRILCRRLGRRAMETLAERDRLEGYVFQDRLAQSLEEFESARGVYPTLADFFPKLMKGLIEWR